MRMLRRRRERGRRRFEERAASVGSGLAGSVPGDGVEEVMLQDYAANLALPQREAAAAVSVPYVFRMGRGPGLWRGALLAAGRA